jgi:hypothetical protein
MLRNRDYRESFVGRMCELLNFELRPERVEQALDEIIEPCRVDLPADWKTWYVPEDQYWGVVTEIREFARARPDVLRAQAREEFSLGDPVRLTLRVSPPGGGAVHIRDRSPDDYPWTGIYFAGMNLSMQAEAATGYRFEGWSPGEIGVERAVTIAPRSDMVLEARFVPSGLAAR